MAQDSLKDLLALDHIVQPKDLQIEGDLLSKETQRIGRFGKAEIEKTAARLVLFFQKTRKGLWHPFKASELEAFYMVQGWDGNTCFFGLRGYYFDDSGQGGVVSSNVPYLFEFPDGNIFVTKYFVENCLLK